MLPLVAIMLAAGCGAVLRAAAGLLWSGPLALAGINILGCALFGLADLLPARWRPVFTTGFCGGLTSFSAYLSLSLGAHHGPLLLGTVVGCWAAVAATQAGVRRWTR